MTLPVRQQSFVFEVTAACNHACGHCYNVWHNPVAYPTVQLDTAATLTLLGKMLDQTGASLVTLTGGEPLLRPDIDIIVDFLVARGITINLISNGSRLEPDTIARLAGKISVFELPLLAGGRDLHDQLSAAPGAFDRVTLAIAGLKAARQRVVAVFVATRLNLPTWRATAELAFALGVDGLMFNRFNSGGRGRENAAQLSPSPAELSAALDVAQQFHEEFALPISCSIPMPPCLFDHRRWPGLSFGYCAAGTERAYYTLDLVGNVRPCNHSPRILGNLCRQDFAGIVTSAAMTEFRAARPVSCAGCQWEEDCLGGCKAAAEACSGDVWACDPILVAHRP